MHVWGHTQTLYICLWNLDSFILSTHVLKQSPPPCWIWILPEETRLLTAKNKLRCSREASLGWQPNLHKAESSLNNKELTVKAKVFLQVQMHVFWNTSKPYPTTTTVFLQCSNLDGVLTSGISSLQNVPGVGWRKAEKTGTGVV